MRTCGAEVHSLVGVVEVEGRGRRVPVAGGRRGRHHREED